MNKKTLLIITVIILTLAGIGGGVYLVKQSQEVREKAAPATTISFQPETKEAKVGETINLNILMDTGENSLAAVRLDIDYDQSILQPLSLSFSSLLPIILRPIDISQPGKVTGSAGVATGASISGTGQKVASLSFKVLSPAPSGTTISFGANTLAVSATTEDESKNLIIRKNPAKIVIATPKPTSTPTPKPTATPTPKPTPTPTPRPTATPTPKPTSTPTPKPTATPTPPECVNNEDCNDRNPCTTETCVSGTCRYSQISCGVYAECNPSTGSCQCSSDNWGNCDNSWNNGCETNLTNKTNCGACGNQCGDDEICREKECVKAGEYPTCLINQMAEALGIDIRYISIVENTDEEWRDGCLGCPEPGEKCAQVITPGKKLVLKSLYQDSNNKCWQYEYHTARLVNSLALNDYCAQYRICEMKEVGCSQCPANGDFNGDGKVNEFDYGILIAHFGEEGVPGEITGDANCDGVVDEFDYGILIAHFGEGE